MDWDVHQREQSNYSSKNTKNQTVLHIRPSPSSHDIVLEIMITRMEPGGGQVAPQAQLEESANDRSEAGDVFLVNVLVTSIHIVTRKPFFEHVFPRKHELKLHLVVPKVLWKKLTEESAQTDRHNLADPEPGEAPF